MRANSRRSDGCLFHPSLQDIYERDFSEHKQCSTLTRLSD